ncbi:MAG: hypothetical protein WC389_22550 [Lutibacter sp.]|jgi:hypothetical protein
MWAVGFIIGFMCASILNCILRWHKGQYLKFIYSDGSWVSGIRRWSFTWKETYGTHHIIVGDGSEEFKKLVGKRIAVPINSCKYILLELEKK